MIAIIFISEPQWGQSNGSTSQTFLIHCAQYFEASLEVVDSICSEDAALGGWSDPWSTLASTSSIKFALSSNGLERAA